MIFFTSDLHFGHHNIIKYCNRPFKDADEMDETLIRNWNEIILETDTKVFTEPDEVYIIGDLSLAPPERTAQILDRLNGKKTLIRGNHDKRLVKKFSYILKDRGIEVFDLLEIAPLIGDKKQPITLCHYPMKVWNHSHQGAWMLHGHSHGNLPDNPDALIMDVGVDCHKYWPVPIDLIYHKMSEKKWKPVDHHGLR